MKSLVALILLTIINVIFVTAVSYDFTSVAFALSTIFCCYYMFARNQTVFLWFEPPILPSLGFVFLLVVTFVTNTGSLITYVNLSSLALVALSIGLFYKLYKANVYIDNQKLVSCFDDWIPKSNCDTAATNQFTFHELKGLASKSNFTGAVSQHNLDSGDVIEIHIDKNLNFIGLRKNSLSNDLIALRRILNSQQKE